MLRWTCVNASVSYDQQEARRSRKAHASCLNKEKRGRQMWNVLRCSRYCDPARSDSLALASMLRLVWLILRRRFVPVAAEIWPLFCVCSPFVARLCRVHAEPEFDQLQQEKLGFFLGASKLGSDWWWDFSSKVACLVTCLQGAQRRARQHSDFFCCCFRFSPSASTSPWLWQFSLQLNSGGRRALWLRESLFSLVHVTRSALEMFCANWPSRMHMV